MSKKSVTPTITTAKIEELIPDDFNANKGTEYGQHLIENSLRQFGAGRSILLDKNNRIIAGNKTVENAGAIGLDDVIVVETTGKQIVAVKRLDVDLDSKEGREMALADNASAKANISWDEENIELLKEQWEVDTDAWGVATFGDDANTNKTDIYGGTKGNLENKFIVPPFSVLDTSKGYWQDRKKAWLEKTGNLSETRDGEFGRIAATNNTIMDSINDGTSNFDPVLAEIMMFWFCPKEGSVLDPFGGEQTKGVVAGELGLQYEAVEFRDDQVQLNQEKTKQYPHIKYVTGDSNNISKLIQRRGFDLCFTSPPYYDLEVYSKEDMSALGTYTEFLMQYENIFSQCFDMLANNAFLVVKIGEIRDKKTGEYRNFIGDNITIFKRLGFKYYNEIILINCIGTGAIRASQNMRTRKVVKIHQNVLVFYKGDLNKIKDKYPEITYNEDELNENTED